MKTYNNKASLVLAAALLMAAVSCNKENSISNPDELTSTSLAAANVTGIAVERTSSGDSIYVINTCERNQKRDSIAFTSLSAITGTYLTDNYAGYTPLKAFSIKDSSGNIKGYVVIIKFNDKPVGLKFDATANFVKVLEQREGRDINGRGYHEGGHFDDRDGKKRDTIALTNLSGTITAYLAANYPQDTLKKAFSTRDKSIIVLSVNNGVFATVFNTSGSFIKRMQLAAKHGRADVIDLSALPAASQTYLTATYPNYVFKHAFKINSNGVLTGYVVFIDSNGTKYAVQFDAAGVFVKAMTVR